MAWHGQKMPNAARGGRAGALPQQIQPQMNWTAFTWKPISITSWDWPWPPACVKSWGDHGRRTADRGDLAAWVSCHRPNAIQAVAATLNLGGVCTTLAQKE